MRLIARQIVRLLALIVPLLCLLLLTIAVGIWALVDWALQPKKEATRANG